MATSTTPGTTRRSLGERCCVAPADRHLTPEAAAQLAGDLQLLGDPVRLQILDLLSARGGEVCVCDLQSALPVKQPTVSHHLRVLHRAGIVTVVRRGLWAFYTLVPMELEMRRSRLQSYLHSLAASDLRPQPQEALDGS